MCSPICQNNGTCTDQRSCNCTEGWEGDVCERGIKSLYCMLMTIISYMISIALCNNECDNGNCTHPDVCQCTEGWNGSTCTQGIIITACIADQT